MGVRQASTIAIALIVAGIATGCTSEGVKAERAYEIVKADEFATADDKCRAAKNAKAAYLADGDSKNYKEWSVVEGRECVGADLERMSEAHSE